jgi:hypothetical protein
MSSSLIYSSFYSIRAKSNEKEGYFPRFGNQ